MKKLASEVGEGRPCKSVPGRSQIVLVQGTQSHTHGKRKAGGWRWTAERRMKNEQTSAFLL